MTFFDKPGLPYRFEPLEPGAIIPSPNVTLARAWWNYPCPGRCGKYTYAIEDIERGTVTVNKCMHCMEREQNAKELEAMIGPLIESKC